MKISDFLYTFASVSPTPLVSCKVLVIIALCFDTLSNLAKTAAMIKAGFILLTLIMASLVYAGLTTVSHRTISDVKVRRQFRLNTFLVLVGWLTYVSTMSMSGIFLSDSLPPRIPLLIVLPFYAFMIWFFRSSRFRDIIASTPASWLVYSQCFRVLVELLLFGLYLDKILPQAGTFEGYNFEIVTGFSALLIGYLGFTKKVLPPLYIQIWNYVGIGSLTVVVFILITHAYYPSLYSNPEPLSLKRFGIFPYTLLAGFLMPLALFMHFFSIIKAKNSRKEMAGL